MNRSIIIYTFFKPCATFIFSFLVAHLFKLFGTFVFRPGGKYGPPDEVTNAQVEQLALRDDLKRASNIAATALQVCCAIDLSEITALKINC